MYSVIVGDIINSRDIDPEKREKIHNIIKETFDRINTKYLSSLIAPFGIVRGDAFEGILLTRYLTPRIIEDIIKSFYSAEKTCVRISAVTDQLTTIAYDRNENDGPAFYDAMENLDKMKNHKSNHWLQIYINTNSLAQSIVASQTKLLISLTEGWTEKQREIAWKMDELKKQSIVGKELGIPTSVVNKQLKAANYETYRLAWDSLEKYLIDIDEYAVMDKPLKKINYISYYNTALHRYNQYNYNEAIILLNKSIELSDNLNSDELNLVPIYNLLANAYNQIYDYNKAKEAICESLKIQDKLPKARIQYVEALRIKSKIYNNEHDYIIAKELINEALNISRNFLNETHPYVTILNEELSLIMKEYRG